MIYEFIATIAAAFGMAGVALLLRHLAKLAHINTSKWLVPVFAAVGIFAFQIHQEYYWFEQTKSRLPQGTVVVRTVEKNVWYRPWSLIIPQTVRFMAVDTVNVRVPAAHPQLKLVNLYLFERRMSAKVVPQVIDCHNNRRADAPRFGTDLSEVMANDELNWVTLTDDDAALRQAVCS